MTSDPNVQERYPSNINRSKILEFAKEEINSTRSAMLSDYESGYGNITGFHLSYGDSKLGKNYSGPIEHPFVENENFSILPNVISRRAANIWNSEGQVVQLPKDRADAHMGVIGIKNNTGVYPLNITGSVKGTFIKVEFEDSPLHPIPLPIPKYLADLYEYRLHERLKRDIDYNNPTGEDNDSFDLPIPQPDDSGIKKVGNITVPEGIVKLSFFNHDPVPNAEIDFNGTTLLSLNLRLNDEFESDEHVMSLHGIYDQGTGNIIVGSRSAKFHGIAALPQLSLQNGEQYQKSKMALFGDFNQTKIEDLKFQTVEDLVDASEECEYVGYFHVESTNLTKEELQQIDYELLNPIGRPHRKIPNLKLTSGLLYSPNCAIALDLHDCQGLRDQVYDNGLKRIILVASIVVLCQILILIRQMAQTNTPSALSKLSFWTISLMNMADGSMSVISLLCSMIFTDLYIQFAVCAFLAFTCSSVYEMKYAIQIYCTQLNERPLDWRTMLQGTPIDERAERLDQANNRTNENGQNTTNNEQTMTADEHAVGAELYTRHFFTMLVFLFVLLSVITWPKKHRQVFEYIFLTIFNSFWIPQIYRNILRGSRTSFGWEFIIGTSILRLVPVIYVESFPNPFNHHKDISFVVFLVIWMSVQIAMMVLQEILGPRFFLSEDYLPKAYDYHPIITKGDIESGFHFDAENLICKGDSSNDEDSRTLTYVTDCAICMQKLEIPVVNKPGETNQELNSPSPSHQSLESSSSLLPSFGKATNIIARRKYMVTPCNHVFHTDCLENWMMYKLQCPVCRNSLPPF